MRLLVLGASGRLGRHLVEQALGHGHEVTAFVQDPARLGLSGDRLRVVSGDVLAFETLAPAVDGQEAVISALGARPAVEVHVLSDGMANAMRAMQARGVRRLVAVSAAGAGSEGDRGLPLSYRLLRRAPGMAALYDDLERMEGDIMLSDLDWTIVRPAGLTDGAQTGEYRVVEGSVVPKGSRISRADVAALVLKSAEADLYVHKAVAVAY